MKFCIQSGESSREKIAICSTARKLGGAVDFGRTDKEDILLVEAHAPFACGWYGDDHEHYTKWQYDAWNNFIKSKRF